MDAYFIKQRELVIKLSRDYCFACLFKCFRRKKEIIVSLTTSFWPHLIIQPFSLFCLSSKENWLLNFLVIIVWLNSCWAMLMPAKFPMHAKKALWALWCLTLFLGGMALSRRILEGDRGKLKNNLIILQEHGCHPVGHGLFITSQVYSTQGLH